jgi:drug/metabolite transporter (DMT)-like permease
MLFTYVKLLGVAFFWGGTFVAGRSLAGQVPPVAAAFLRFAFAALILLAVVWRRESFPRLNVRQFLVIVSLGATGVMAYNLFFFKGLSFIGAGRASLIIALNPVFIALTSTLIHKESLPKRRAAGMLLSITGAIIVITRGAPLSILHGGIGYGELLIFGCVLSWTLYSVIGKTAMRGLSPLVAVCYSSLAGALMLFLLALTQGQLATIFSYPPAAWLALLYLGLFGTVIGFLWYFQAIARIGPSRAAVFINFVPVNGVLLSTLILDEPLTLSLLTGGVLVICGSYLANSQ